MQASATMDCDGNVAVHITNDTASTFHGQSATADSWIVNVTLAPGQSTTIAALFKYQKSETGYVSGRYDGDPTFVNVKWTATRACEVVIPPTAPVDTTPAPIPTTTPGQTIIYCSQPGAIPPKQVPCDSPEATTPYPTPTTATTAPAASGDPEASTVAPTPASSTQGRTGPPRTQAIVAAKSPVKSLPETGAGGVPMSIGGTGVLALGVFLVWLTRRRAVTP